VEGGREDVLGIRRDVTEILRLLTAPAPVAATPVASSAPHAAVAANGVVARFGAHLAARRAAAAASAGPGLPSDSTRSPLAEKIAPRVDPQGARAKQQILLPPRPPGSGPTGKGRAAPADWNLAGELIRVLIPEPATAATSAAAADAVHSSSESPPRGLPQSGNGQLGTGGCPGRDGEAAKPAGGSQSAPLPSRMIQKVADNLPPPTSTFHPAVAEAAADRAVPGGGSCLSSEAPAPHAATAVEARISPSPAGPQPLSLLQPPPPAATQSPSLSPSPSPSPSPSLETQLLGLVGCWEGRAAHSRLKIFPAGAARAGGTTMPSPAIAEWQASL
jgi:hypothetical protein